jgi:SMI1 / KNR4 family (SUKH-1)
VIEAGWLGFPAASETEIEALETRLNKPLPPSYRAFLMTSNGFRQPDMLVPRIYSVHEVGWLRDIDPRVLEPIPDPFYAPLPVSDEDYFVYGDEQATFNMRDEYVPSTLRISEREESGSAMYLLNPEIVTEDGEWEAWMMAHWLPGAHRYRSFWDLMQGERKTFLWRR